MKDDVGNAALLGRMAWAGKELAGQGRTNAKFPLIKKALADACQGLPPDTRLPSIREIAAALGATVVPVQRAVNELKQEGLLHAKRKSGLYSPGAAAAPTGMAGFKRRIRFLTDSVLPEQRALWDAVARDFHNTQDYIAVDIDYRAPGDTPTHSHPPDVLECAEWGFHRHFHELGLLRLRDFLDGAPEAAFLGDRLATIYNQSAFLYYNATALGRHLAPDGGLAEQFELCRALKGGSSIQPVLLAGRLVGELMKTLRAGQSPDDTGLPERFQHLVELATSFSYRIGGTPERDELFMAGATPLLLGNSDYLGSFRRRGLPFEWGFRPVLNVEGSLVKIPVAAAVLEQTASPMESVRWIKHLLSAPVQGKFADFGYFTAARPPDERFAASPPLFAATHAEHYVGVYIVNAELWNCINGKQSAATAWRDVVAYAKAYLAGTT